MYLGISYDKWHGILANLTVGAVTIFSWYLLDIKNPSLNLIVSVLLGTIIAHHLQSWNESKQAIDPKLVKKYGSLENFQNNSKKDWKYFWYGTLSGWVIPIIIIIFF